MVHRCGGACEMMWSIDMVVYGRCDVHGRCGDSWYTCGGVGGFGGVWELWWCMEDVMVHGRCCGACIEDVMLMDGVVHYEMCGL